MRLDIFTYCFYVLASRNAWNFFISLTLNCRLVVARELYVMSESPRLSCITSSS